MSRVTARRPTLRISPTGTVTRPDTLAVEEPLEIRTGGESLTVTMRTPGADIDLIHGFLYTEGIITAAEDIRTARYCAGTDENGQNTYNLLDIQFRTPITVRPRNFLTNSACGLCGKTALDEVRTRLPNPIPAPTPLVDVPTLAKLPDQLRSLQQVFAATGGLHAAGLFTPDGTPLVVREDVGRHNAVDKVIGWALRESRLTPDLLLMVSSRASFELVQKAAMAGLPFLGAVSAPSSLAVDLATETGITLVGFLRGDSMNVYSAPERVIL